MAISASYQTGISGKIVSMIYAQEIKTLFLKWKGREKNVKYYSFN